MQMEFLDPRTKALVMWQDPKKTGAMFGGSTLIYYFLEQSGYTAISLVSNLLLLAVIGSFLWSSASRFMNKPSLSLHVPEIDEQTARTLAEHFQTGFNKAGLYSNRVLSGTEPILTLKTAGVLYVVSRFGGWFHFWTLCYMVVFCVFTVPKVYEMKQTEIDQLLAKASKQLGAYSDVLKQNATNMLNKAKEGKKAE